MGSSVQSTAVAASTHEALAPWSPPWLARWFEAHGLAGVPVDGPPALLAVCVAAELEGWCEERGVPRSSLAQARRAAARTLPAGGGCGGAREAARDAAAWHRLRTVRLSLAS